MKVPPLCQIIRRLFFSPSPRTNNPRTVAPRILAACSQPSRSFAHWLVSALSTSEPRLRRFRQVRTGRKAVAIAGNLAGLARGSATGGPAARARLFIDGPLWICVVARVR